MLVVPNPQLDVIEPIGALNARDTDILAFERQAGLAIGGYPDLPTRSISAGIAAIFTKRTT